MCGFAAEGMAVTKEQLMTQFKVATSDLSPEDEVVKIYTSGSFFDIVEVAKTVRVQILDQLSNLEVNKVVLESRPEYVTPEVVQDSVSRIRTEIAIGLESSNNLVSTYAIRKGFTFVDFKNAAEIVHQSGGSVKTYLLLKPPFLSESVAIKDVLRSANVAAPYSDVFSLNLCNIQRNTFLEQMWNKGDYRTPWLWSAVEILKNVHSRPIICDPVAAGARRGPHNCGECDADVAKVIRDFSLTQDTSLFNELECGCKAAWEKVVELEDYTFGAPLD